MNPVSLTPTSEPAHLPTFSPCCEKAVVVPDECVCRELHRCPDHGERHFGSHD